VSIWKVRQPEPTGGGSANTGSAPSDRPATLSSEAAGTTLDNRKRKSRRFMASP
jgi:hypothetical protein